MRILRWLFTLLLLAAAALGITYYFAGTANGPAITIAVPPVIGQSAAAGISVTAPGGQLTALSAQLEQNGRTFDLLPAADGAERKVEGDTVHLTVPVGRKAVPDLQAGPATIRVSATRPVLRGLREVASESSAGVNVRLTPPRITVASTHHYVNLGGAELVVYRVSPPQATSGVRVGNDVYPGFDGKAVGFSDPDLKVAIFSVPYDQKGSPAIELFARDEAGNDARAQFDHRVFPKTFRRSRIPLDDRFLSRVVPAILQTAPNLGVSGDDLVAAFLKINNDLRRTNNATIAALAAKTAPDMLWEGAFQPLGGSQVESSFADFRTYTYAGKEIDQQVHLGFDLAKTANAPVASSNHGRVVFADELGIYGNTVVVDHGLGVQSLYAHLSSFAVREGEDVRKGQILGTSGQTGLAGGDHVHFSMLVNGRFVNATEWWDPKWMQDRVLRKLTESGASLASTPE